MKDHMFGFKAVRPGAWPLAAAALWLVVCLTWAEAADRFDPWSALIRPGFAPSGGVIPERLNGVDLPAPPPIPSPDFNLSPAPASAPWGWMEIRLFARAGGYGNGSGQEVSPSCVFHAGDQLRLEVRPSRGGYLHLVHFSPRGRIVAMPIGPRGETEVFAPSRRWLSIPHGDWMTFDRAPGIERLCLVLSRRHLPDPISVAAGDWRSRGRAMNTQFEEDSPTPLRQGRSGSTGPSALHGLFDGTRPGSMEALHARSGDESRVSRSRVEGPRDILPPGAGTWPGEYTAITLVLNHY
ncbi:MAG: hypothetical protein NTW86_22715 [Candidatus Sumerlaeota bacterium]|nr:hypothetical protein [Candidatus Sumerlaeota bacterium]